MRCPRCGTENPPETLFCQNCDWRLDMKFRPDKMRNTLELAGITIILGLASVVCCFFDAALVGAGVGAIAMVLGGYSVSVCKLMDPGSKKSFMISALGLMLGVIGFLVGFSAAVGALRWRYTAASTC